MTTPLPSTSGVLVLLWHPSEMRSITAGGWARTREILTHAPPDIVSHVVDTSPSIAQGLGKNIVCHEYRAPAFISSIRNRSFALGRILEWSHAMGAQFRNGAGVLWRHPEVGAVYVPTSELFYTAIPGILLALLFGRRLVLVNLNIGTLTWRPDTTMLSMLLHNGARLLPDYRLLTISHDLANDLHRAHIGGSILINGVGLDTRGFERARPRSGPKRKKTLDALFIGRHVAFKGVFDFPDIWKAVVATHPRARLGLMGSCDPDTRRDLQARFSKLGLEKNILFLGEVSEHKKAELLHSSRLFVFPSYLEGWGIAPQEAMACGVPVVAYDLSVYSENIRGCPSLTLVPKGDKPAMAQAISRLLTKSDAQLTRLGAPGVKWVARFDWPSVARREFELICASEVSE